ncbi:protein kinase [Streptomyces sp. A15ISP2-DRY2]|uniref:non-specific serine/threonine protein kinase n=2 Tax=Streptomyces ortus TaxID=2867268 RepID=A0ABT3V9L9_9ACTN|nr:serine/threonine protein kinase [Streptomyces ortus]MCX4236645.1 protein kinase [Streptomyces ortus]
MTRGGIPGLLVTGRYRLVESIGQGGMGRVWRAADETLDRQVAVKEMRIDGMDQEDARTRRERTLREARATARIDHPNVVRVYDVVDEGERLWIVMELVDGRSLERVVAEDGPLSPRAAARIGLELVAALDQVHAGGVLHRDIKPANVLIERRAGRVVLTDFGIAAIQNAEALTMAGMLVGSPDYMAPERVSGRPQGPPSDLWSLGATLCAALGGRSPFSRATTLATLHAVLYEEPEIPAAAGEGELRDALTALLLKDPADRPALEDLAAILGPAADGTAGTAALTVPVTAPGAEEAVPEAAPEATPDTSPEATPEATPGSGPAPLPEPDEPAARAATTPAPPRVERTTPLYVRIPPPEPVEDAVPAGHAPTREAPPSEPLPNVENTSSEAPREGTPELPSEGAAPGQAFRAPGVRLERHKPPPPAPRPPQPKSEPQPQPVPELKPESEPEGNAEPPTRPGSTPAPSVLRKGLITAGGVVVAGALAALLIPMLGGSSGDKDHAGPSAASSPTVAGTARPPSLPAGSRTEAGMYAWVPPDGWDRVAQSGAEVHYTSPDRKQEILANASPARGDLLEQWKKTEVTTSEGLDYQRIRLEETTFRGAPAVVWEYTVTAKGLPWHARLLGFDVDGKTYEVTTWYQPDVEDRALRVYENLKKTFTPL